VVNIADVSGQPIGFLTLEDGTDILSRNVGRKLTLIVADSWPLKTGPDRLSRNVGRKLKLLAADSLP